MNVRDILQTTMEGLHPAASAFNAHANEYDSLRRRLVPPFDALYGTAVDALDLLDCAPLRVLDLGAGTGVLSSFVRARHPSCELVLLDSAARMLDRASETIEGPATFKLGDLREELPAGPFDAVISALAIHHLSDPEKQDLLARVHDALRPGGLFVNAEHVAAPSAELERRYENWHEQTSTGLGSSPAEWAAAQDRMSHDRRTDTIAQLKWLGEAGFVDVDCLFKQYGFAVLLARRPAS